MKIDLAKRQVSIGEIIQMQDKLNSKADINNPDWRNIRKKEDFTLAALLEFAELIESNPWKWWKKKSTVDYWNIKIEAIDILHFIASILLIDGFDKKEKMLIGAKDRYKKKLLPKEEKFNISYALELFQDISKNKDLITVLNKLMSSVDLSAEEISAIYIAKYYLNEIRWSNGYSDGTYQKKRYEGLEDNVFLKDIVEDFLSNPKLLLSDIKKRVLKELKLV